MPNRTIDIKPILNNVPAFVDILLEAQSSAQVSEWTLEDYKKALKWSEYFEKVTTTHTSPETYQMINHKIKSALESHKFVLSVSFTATSFVQARYLLLELLLGNHFIPKPVFTEAILDIFKLPDLNSKLLENMQRDSQEASMERILHDMHSIVNVAESNLAQGQELRSSPQKYRFSTATLRKKTTATLIVSSSKTMGGEKFSNWILDILGKSPSNTHSLEVVCWMLTELPHDANLSQNLINMILNLPDQTIFTIHPWLLAEVAKLHFAFFNGLLAKVFTHLQHLIAGGFDCSLGNYCSAGTLHMQIQYLMEAGPQVHAVLSLLMDKHPQVKNFFQSESVTL